MNLRWAKKYSITRGAAMTTAAAIDSGQSVLCADWKACTASESGVQVGRLEVDQRVEEVAPLVDEREQRDRDERRLGQRQDDPPQDAQVVGAVDAGGVGQLGRDAQEELAQQEDEEGIAEQGRAR